MLDHIGFPVSDYARSKAFYLAALAPLGHGLVMELTPEMTGGRGSVAGFGPASDPAFWISSGTALKGTLHVAFAAKTRADVDAFYRAALAAGATDNGAPGLRPQYHPGYYGAFVLDPDGHNIEAVCHGP
ncbi:VOC family protein [Sorangium sp. So ce1036]|uniref:VOC family protein n=1 Tax=Sorangium sp. So ce1036 TaxID=3133328 RepID=UPI003F5261B6